MREARLAAGKSQAQLIADMRAVARDLKVSLPACDDTLKTYIRRWERGQVSVGTPEYRQVFRRVYGMTDAELGFAPLDEETLTVAAAQPSLLTRDALDYFGTLFTEHLRADNMMGSRYVIDIVTQQARTLAQAARQARGRARQPTVDMACRYLEFLGWLHQDAGNCEQAMVCTDRARDLALELNDPLLAGYLLMRKSNIAADDDDPGLAIALADAGLASARSLTPKVRAVLLRTKANGHAALGDVGECVAALGAAYGEVWCQDPDGHALAGYCTPGYLSMEAGTCWMQLGQPDHAVEAFSLNGTQWSETQRRDRGLAVARLASAHAAAGNVEEACQFGAEAVRAMQMSSSARILRELRRLRGQMSAWPSRPEAAAISSAIASTPATLRDVHAICAAWRW